MISLYCGCLWCGCLNHKCHHSLEHLSTWLPVGGIACGGLGSVALLEDIERLKTGAIPLALFALGSSKVWDLNFSSSLHANCSLPFFLAMPSVHPFGTLSQLNEFLQWVSCFSHLFYYCNRKETCCRKYLISIRGFCPAFVHSVPR